MVIMAISIGLGIRIWELGKNSLVIMEIMEIFQSA
jgi:hypothetical protein